MTQAIPYAVLDANGVCINRVRWDGESDWQPPEGCTAVADPDNNYPVIQSEPLNGPDYLAFWDSLLTSSVYNSLRNQAMSSLAINTLATEFIALIGDAKAGRPNEAAIGASIGAILQNGTFTQADLMELQGCLVAGHLDGIYSLGE